MSSSSEPGSDATAQLWNRRAPGTPAIGFAAALTGNGIGTLGDAVALSLALSREARRLLDGMELRVRTLTATVATTNERCIYSVRGPVQWAETMTARANSFGSDDVFVCAAAERSFDAAADGPAGGGAIIGEGADAGFGDRGLDVAVSETARDVAEDRTGGEADAGAHGAEPIGRLAVGGAGHARHIGAAAAKAAALDVGFEAVNDRAEQRISLPVPADLTAAEAALRRQVQRVVVGVAVHGAVAADADACVHAHVEAGPVVNGDNRGLVIGGLHGEVSCLGADGGSDQRGAGEKNAFHGGPHLN